MQVRTEVKVGLTVFTGILALLAVYWFLGGHFVRARSYPIHAVFRDARKLDKGADVRMAGVRIGLVSAIRLTSDSRARVEMIIFNDYPIPKDSVARITSGGIIGDNYIEILPGAESKRLRPGQRLASAQLVQFDQLIEEAGGLVRELQSSTQAVNRILGDRETADAVKRAVLSLSETAASAAELVKSAKMVVDNADPAIDRVLANLDAATADAARAGREIREMIAYDARPNVRALLTEAAGTLENLNKAVTEAQNVIASFDRGTAELVDALARANAAAADAQEIMSNLRDASGEIKDLASDRQMQENLRRTLQNAAEASEQAKELMTDLNRRFGRSSSREVREDRSSIPGRGAAVDALWNTDSGNYRLDANYTFAGGSGTFYRIGCYDVGEDARLNLQKGTLLGNNSAYRFGLYRSRLGVGYDLRIGRSSWLSADVYRPNDPEMELRATFGLGNGLGLYTGVTDVFHGSRRDLLLGVRYDIQSDK